jgi:septal ring factor EnvC (AmiA/AmiB activator)
MLIKTSKRKSIFLDNKNVIRMVKIVDDKDKFLGRSLKELIKEHQELKLEQVNSKIDLKQIRAQIKDLKAAVKCVEKHDKKLADNILGLVSDVVVGMKLTPEEAVEWE